MKRIFLLSLILISAVSAKSIKAGTLLAGISTLDVMNQVSGNIRVTTIRFRKTPEIIAAVAKGEVDVAVIPVDMAAKLFQTGLNIKIIAVDMFQNQAVLTMNPQVKSIRDLKGRKIAALVASGTYMMFKSYAKLIAGLEAGKDFKVINAAPGALPDILRRGDADAVVAWEPIVSILIGRGAKVVASFEDLWQKLGNQGDGVMLVWITSPGFTDTMAINEFKKMRKSAAIFWISHHGKTIKILQKLYNFPKNTANSIYRRTRIYTGDLDKQIIENIRKVWEISWKGGYLKENPEKIPETIFYRQ